VIVLGELVSCQVGGIALVEGAAVAGESVEDLASSGPAPDYEIRIPGEFVDGST
jgi:hypothetical protein